MLLLLISVSRHTNSATPSQVTPFMVAPFTDLRDWNAENLIYLVFLGCVTRPTLPASLNTQCFKSRKAPCNYQDIISISTDLCQSVQNHVALFQVFQCFVKNEAEQCCRQTISYDKRVTYFPIHYYFGLGSVKCHFQELFYLFGYSKTC